MWLRKSRQRQKREWSIAHKKTHLQNIYPSEICSWRVQWSVPAVKSRVGSWSCGNIIRSRTISLTQQIYLVSSFFGSMMICITRINYDKLKPVVSWSSSQKLKMRCQTYYPSFTFLSLLLLWLILNTSSCEVFIIPMMILLTWQSNMNCPIGF